MRERKDRAYDTYDIVQKANVYVKTRYGDMLDKPQQKYMRDMILETISSKSLILSQMSQKIQGVTDTCQNSHQTEKRLSYNLNSQKWSREQMRIQHYHDMLGYVTDQTLIILDLPDMQKPYGRKLPDLKEVHDGSTGETGICSQVSDCFDTSSQIGGAGGISLLPTIGWCG